jgi:hypothetical protein
MAQAAERYAEAAGGRAARPPLAAFWTGDERSVMRVWQRSPALAWSLALPIPAAPSPARLAQTSPNGDVP